MLVPASCWETQSAWRARLAPLNTGGAGECVSVWLCLCVCVCVCVCLCVCVCVCVCGVVQTFSALPVQLRHLVWNIKTTQTAANRSGTHTLRSDMYETPPTITHTH